MLHRNIYIEIEAKEMNLNFEVIDNILVAF